MKELRPYQGEAIKSVEQALARNVNKSLVVLPTGSGKTYTAVKLIEHLRYKRGLWITDRESLITQSAVAFIRSKFDAAFADQVESVGFVDYIRSGGTFDGFKMGLIKADVFKPEGDIVISSAQTLHNRLHLLDPNEFDYVICDEAHGFCAASYVKSVNFFNPKLLLGLTATPYRADGMPMGDIFDEIVYEYGMRDAIRDGYLCSMDGVRVKTTTNLDGIHTIGGDFNQRELSNEVNSLARNNLVCDSYLKYGSGRQGIFFAVDIQHAIDLEEAFVQKGVNAKAISSKEDLTGDSFESISRFKKGNIDVLINVNLVSVGFDHPDTGIIGAVAPTKSKTRYVQQIGRGSRLKSEGFVSKFGQNCIILDFVDNTSKHSLINAHELDKGLPPEERVFITEENRQKLIDAREQRSVKITHFVKEDEKINLMEVPKIRVSKSIRMREPATEKQLAVIEKWGYDVKNDTYTKGMIQKIFDEQPASDAQLRLLRAFKYDVDNAGFISIVRFKECMKEIETRPNYRPRPASR